MDTDLAYLYRPFLDIEVGIYGGGLRHIRVLYLCKRISHSPNGGFTREQDIYHPNRPRPRSRRLPLQGDVL